MEERLNLSTNFITPEQTQKGRGLTRKLGELSTNQLLLITETETPEQLSNTAHLTVRPDYSEGRRESFFGVWFADMTIHGKGGSEDDTLARQPVAIKPLDIPSLAAQELRTATDINSHDQRRLTFQPIGFANIGRSDGSSNLSIITEFEEGVTSFDNVLYKSEKLDDGTVAWALGCAARGLIILHDLGYEHGDYQVQNTAYDTGLQPRIIDITSSKKRNNPRDFTGDLKTYIGSLSYFDTRKPVASKEQILDCFLAPYREEIPNMFPRDHLRREVHKAVDCIAATIDDILSPSGDNRA
mgnify:FL=1|jgi:hypothetical protein